MKKIHFNESAFTLLEVLVSLSLFSIGAVSVARSFSQHLAYASQADRRSGAIDAAQQVLDGLRVLDPSTLPKLAATTTQNVNVGGRTYAVTTTFCPTAYNSYCASNSSRYLSINVTYRGLSQYKVDTIFSQLR